MCCIAEAKVKGALAFIRSTDHFVCACTDLSLRICLLILTSCGLMFFDNQTKNWARAADLVLLLCVNGSKLHDDFLQTIFQNTFDRTYQRLFRLPLRAPMTPSSEALVAIQAAYPTAASSLALSPAQLQARNHAIDDRNRRSSQHYANVLRVMTRQLQSSDVHWRYRLMSLAVIQQLIR